MTEDKLLTAVERVAVGHGLPHHLKTGLGLSYDQIEDLQNLIDVAIGEFREQLIEKLEERREQCTGYQTDFGAGERHTIHSALNIVRNAEYH